MLYEQAGIPHMQAGGQPPQNPYASRLQQAGVMGGLGPNVDMTPSNPIKLWGADPTGKFGGKDRMQTQPWTLDRTSLENHVKAMRAAEPLGVPQFSPEELLKMQLPEGDRSDFGANRYDTNNKQANRTYDILREMGHDPSAATFAAALQSNAKLAQIKNKPFLENWNGLGKSALSGRTGAQHNERANEWGYAVNHPKNADFLNMLKEAYNYQPPVKQNLGANEYATPMGDYQPTVEQNQRSRMFAAGGSTTPFYDMSKLLIQKHLSGN
jgi:hypothetical protein